MMAPRPSGEGFLYVSDTGGHWIHLARRDRHFEDMDMKLTITRGQLSKTSAEVFQELPSGYLT